MQSDLLAQIQRPALHLLVAFVLLPLRSWQRVGDRGQGQLTAMLFGVWLGDSPAPPGCNLAHFSFFRGIESKVAAALTCGRSLLCCDDIPPIISFVCVYAACTCTAGGECSLGLHPALTSKLNRHRRRECCRQPTTIIACCAGEWFWDPRGGPIV